MSDIEKHELTPEEIEIEIQKEMQYLRDTDDVPEIPENIAERFSDLIKSYEKYAGKLHESAEVFENDMHMIREAYLFAYKAHRNQKRKSGELYIIHPIAVAQILVELEVDAETIEAALLHDTVEDTVVDIHLITEIFGENVALLVDGVTKLGKIPYVSKEDIQAENVRKMFVAMAKDIRVVLIKLADRLHNMRTMKHQSPEKQIEISRETLDIYAPLAHRLGIYKIKWELEDLCLRYLDKDAYYELVGMISSKRSEREQFMADVVAEISAKVKEYGIKHVEIEGRPKHFYSIYNKMKEQNKTLEQIYDLFACRIIVETLTDCYTVLGIVHEMYQHIPGRFKDYIAMPKPNMYQSIHTTVLGKGGVPFEIQIRTFAMHRTAEYGIAAHWHYKEAGNSEVSKFDQLDSKMNWIRQILDSQKETKDPTDFMDVLKSNLTPDTVYVFTPKGDVINLPKGSCPIDFAYNIHSGIGNHMHGAKVNGRIVPLSYELKNGDIVEVLSSDKIHGPSRDWAKMVKTASARSKINAWFKKESRAENIADGRELLEREMQRNGFSPQQLLLHKSLEGIFRKYSYSNLEDIYAAIGYGVLTPGKVFSKLRDEYIKSLPEEERTAMGYRINSAGQVLYTPSELVEDIGKNSLVGLPKNLTQQSGSSYKPLVKRVQEKKTKTSTGVIVEGLENCHVHLSNCCHPVPGDEIIGYVTQTGGVGIHRTNCANIINLHKYASRSPKDKERENRLIKVHWDNYSPTDIYEVEMKIVVSDRRYILNEITSAISEEHVFISSISSQSKPDFTAVINLVVEVRGQTQFDRLIGRIKSIKDVISAGRA